MARKKPLAFGYNPGSGPADDYFGLDLRKPAKVVGKAAKDEGVGKKAAFGTVTVEGKLMSLTCDKELPSMAKKLKKYLKSQKVNLNIQILGPDGSILDSDVEEGLPDDPDLAEAPPAVAPTEAPVGPETAPTPPAAVSPEPLAEGDVLVRMKGDLKALGARVQGLDADARKPFTKPYTQLVEMLKAKEVEKLEAGLAKVSAALDKIVASAGAGAPPPPDGPPAGDGEADPNAAKWLAIKSKLEGEVAAALKRNAGDVSKIRAVWGYALEQADGNKFAVAIKAAAEVNKLLREAESAAPEGAREGTVETRKKELQTGKEILAALKSLGPDLKAAIKVLPEKLNEAKGFAGEIQSAVSSNDLDLARVTLTKVELLIAEAARLRQRAADELIEVSKLFDAAIEKGTGDLDGLRAAFAFAQGKLENEEYAAALASFEKVRELAAAAAAADTSDQQDAAAAGAEMAKTIAALEDAAALRAELEAYKVRMDLALPFMPYKSGDAATLYTDATAASRTDDLTGAKAKVTAYATLLAEIEFEKTVIEKRKKNLLESLAKLTTPEGATEDEAAAFEAQRTKVTEALAAVAPTSEDFGRATDALRAFDQLIAPAQARAALRAALAKVVADRDAKSAEIDQLKALPGDTKLALKLQRALVFQSAQIDKLTGAEKLKPAEAMLKSLLATITQLQAEEAEITKAAALKEQALREHGALKGDLDVARTIYEVSAEFKADVTAFQNADSIAGLRLNGKEYGRALAAIDVLRRATAKLLARKAEFDVLVALRKTVLAKSGEFAVKYAEAQLTLENTTEAAQLFKDTEAAAKAAEEAAKVNDWPTVDAQISQGLIDAQRLIDLKDTCAALQADRDDALQRFVAVRDGTDATRSRTGATPDFLACVASMNAKIASFVEAYNTAGDVAKCVALVGELETLAQELTGLDAADQQAQADRRLMRDEYAKVQAKLNDAHAVKPYTDKMMGLFAAFTAAWDVLLAADKTAAPGAMDALTDAVAKADAVLAEKAESDKAKAAARQACADRVLVVEPDVDDALDETADNAPDLDTFDRRLNDKWVRYEDLLADERYLEAVAVLDELAVISAETQAAVAGAQAAKGLRETEFEAKYNDVFVARVAAVLQFSDINDEIKDLKKQVDDLSDECDDADVKDNFVLGLEKFAALEPVLVKLEGLKADHDRLVADRKWFSDEWTALKTDRDLADAMEPVDRETEDKITVFRASLSAAVGLFQAKEYTKARAAFAALKTALAELLTVKAQHDLLKPKRDAVAAEWAKISATYTKANAMRPLTPELEKLVARFDEVMGLYRKAFFGHDYDAALIFVADVGKAANALVAKETDHAAADLAAAQKATVAETQLDAIDPADLKTKTTEEKIDLLNALRGQKKSLTQKQRELQIKVYMSMELDPDFIKVDDERRDKLKEAIRDDQELQAARANWADTDPGTMISAERKVALLTKTLKAECEIYGMPVPTVQTFSEPPGDLGSFNPSTNVININTHEEATFDDFFDTIDTIVHENAHNYQDYLVQRLQEGLILPGDPEYKQALMFAANSDPYGYVVGKEDRDCYLKQPLEEHAWKTGGDVQKALKQAPTV
ncbi:hypothetical protein [Tritonibacter horizontis]|nr:hypothetical protein [Tritonibacter horizontis]